VSENLVNLIRPEIKQLSAYHVADASGLIKLDAMENPYVLPEELLNQLQQSFVAADLNRYPDPSAGALTQQLRKTMQVPEDKAIVLGNGSDELIQMLAMALAKPDACLMSFEPGFVMYQMIAKFTAIHYVGVPLSEDFNLDMDATREAIKKHQPAIIFIAYPNNPSANLFNDDAIEEIIKIAPGLVVVDEAYHPFAQASFMSKLSVYKNLLVMRTVSKMGLAGLRLGLLCGEKNIINEIDKIRLPYNINVLTQAAGLCVLGNVHVLDQQAALIREQRALVLDEMRAVDGLEVFPSQANFILFRVLNKSANDVFESIKTSGVLIKNMKAKEGALVNCLRVTIGAQEENMVFLAALKQAMKN